MNTDTSHTNSYYTNAKALHIDTRHRVTTYTYTHIYYISTASTHKHIYTKHTQIIYTYYTRRYRYYA